MPSLKTGNVMITLVIEVSDVEAEDEDAACLKAEEMLRGQIRNTSNLEIEEVSEIEVVDSDEWDDSPGIDEDELRDR